MYVRMRMTCNEEVKETRHRVANQADEEVGLRCARCLSIDNFWLFVIILGVS